MGTFSLFDKLLAAIVGLTIALLMAHNYTSGQESRADVSRYYANRVRVMNFIEVVQQDLRNAGMDTPSGSGVVDWDDTAPTDRFAFRGPIDNAASPTIGAIAYELQPVSRPLCADAGVQCYEIVRRVNGGAGTAISPSTVTGFEIKLFDESGAPIGSLADARKIKVSVDGLSPLGEKEAIERRMWQGRFQPANLSM